MIVISGISSSLGISLSLKLASRGIRVLGFARRVDSIKQTLSHPLIQLQVADLNDTALIRSICSNADAIVHLAALSAPWGRYADFYHINVEGTKSITAAAKNANIKRFIHVSTPSIYFDYRDRLNILETDPLPKRSVNAYAATKKLAEEVVDLAYADGLPCITLRPRAIFGPHDKILFPRILKACQGEGIPVFSKRRPIVDITHVDNVAHALWLALNAPSFCLGQKYNITNGEPNHLDVILELLFNELHIQFNAQHISYPLAYLAALFSEFKGCVTKKEPSLTRYGVGVLTYSQTLSIEKAKKELNYRPIISLKEGIQQYASWLQTQ